MAIRNEELVAIVIRLSSYTNSAAVDLTAANLLLNTALRDDAWHDGYVSILNLFAFQDSS